MAEFSAAMPGLMKQMTLQVKMQRHRQAMFRLRLCVWIMRFAAWVGGFGGFEVE